MSFWNGKYYKLVIGTGTDAFYLAPRASIGVEESSNFEQLVNADAACGGCGFSGSRTFTFTIYFEGGCSLRSAWSLYSALQEALCVTNEDGTPKDILLERRVYDEDPLIYKITKNSMRMVDVVNQYTAQHILSIEFIVTLVQWPPEGVSEVVLGA